MKIKLIWKLFPTYVFLTIFSISFVTFFMWDAVKKFHVEQSKEELKAKAVLLEEIYSREEKKRNPDIDKVFKRTGKSIGTRITFIKSDGTVIADSKEDISKMENHADRPEIIEAMNGETGISTRYSKTLKKEMLYVAIPFIKEGKTEGVTRTSLPSITLVNTLKPVTAKFVIVGAIAAAVAILFSIMFSMFITKPITKILSGIEHFSKGEFNKKFEVGTTYEFAKLSENMNAMAVELKSRIDTITKQRNELARLENIRKEFVANVSHELRTPITSIKGYIETLKDGAINDKKNAVNFLGILSRQTERLNNIIEDLLSLSRIEREDGIKGFDLSSHFVFPVIENAVNTLISSAEKNKIKIKILCPEKLKAKITPRLFEQALVNLIDNAVKYSESGSEVIVSAEKIEGKIVVKVKDSGCGIEEEHLDRLFERFYRVDKARSRKMGGTGLGLAIVKHIVQSHNGNVAVESSPGKGSVFSIIIPDSAE